MPTNPWHESSAWRAIARQAVADPLPKGLDAIWSSAAGTIARIRSRQSRLIRDAYLVTQRLSVYEDLDQDAIDQAIAHCRSIFRCQRVTPGDTCTGLALACAAAQRTLGLTPHIEQITAALAMYRGACVEMATGEGKTLVGAIAATLEGWRGQGCHVITANDYLAKRDARTLEPLYSMLGLTAASVHGGSDSGQRRLAYACDVTYCTSKEAAADALRDRIASRPWRTLGDAMVERALGRSSKPISEQLLTRGQASAIVDEADAVLIDEGVTPLILSAPVHNADQETILRQAAAIAATLVDGEDYITDRRFNDVRFTRQGLDRIDAKASVLHGVWGGLRRRRELVDQAIRVRTFFREGEQYIIRDGKVVIVDESTGRLMPDRSWRQGLHQAIEASEGLEPTPINDTLARISFQRYFRGYRRLSGMTGTAREVRRELWSIYGLPLVTIPSHAPCQRTGLPMVTTATASDRWDAIVKIALDRHCKGQPVLIGTRTVDASERVGRMLEQESVGHEILNAVREDREAETIARAGQRGAVTVATNMAGRGTDIVLGDGVEALGGLCVLVTEPHQSSRLDRQLMGRSARQGDRGESIRFMSLEDDLLLRQVPRLLRWLAAVFGGAPVAGRLLCVLAQRRAMRHARSQRLSVLRQDEWLDESLGFAGPE